MQAICFANIVSTITYDEANAPFLAIRCLHQFAIENQDRHPGASRVILNDFYVDLLSGGNDVSKLRRLKGEVTDILQYAGFHLHKWNTNEPIIFDGSSEVQELPRSNEIKTLRIYWNTTDDWLRYWTCAIEKNQRATKRTVLSTITQIYDPLGTSMGPVTVRTKIILQQLWQLKIEWDESLWNHTLPGCNIRKKWRRWNQSQFQDTWYAKNHEQ